MRIYTVKLTKGRILAILLSLGVILAAIILGIPGKKGAQATAGKAKVTCGDDCIAFLENLGYQVESQPVEEKQVVIPKQFDTVYENYNRIQQEAGYDLEKYRGREVTMYTYNVTNYPSEENVRCDLLVRKGAIVGGNIYTVAIDGFMHGLRAVNGEE